MLILALDAALAACSVAIVDGETGTVLAAMRKDMDKGHAEAIAPMLHAALTQADCSVHDLARIVVTTGPGSYTGLRVGLSAAHGLALASGLPLIGVSSLAALAASMAGKDEVLAAIDARHDHVYAAMYQDNKQILAPAYLSVEAARALITPATRIAGNGQRLLGEQGHPHVPDMRALAMMAKDLDPQHYPPTPLYLKAVDAKPKTQRQPVETANFAV